MSAFLMRYKNYVWPRNPREITISVENNVKEIEIPKNGSVFQNYGRKKRTITGTGEFCGQNCFNDYENLLNIFKDTNASGYLVLPNMDPFLAAFKSFKLLGDPQPNLVSYTFVFWENVENIYQNETNIEYEFFITSGNETLWDISLTYNLDISDLLNLNPFIYNPNEILQSGVRVSLC